MISGANEEELELAEARMDIMLATNYTTENPGPLAIIDKYHDKEIERLSKEVDMWNKKYNEQIDIINELEAMFDGDLDGFFTINEKGSCNEIIEVIQNYKNKLKELKEGK